MTGVSFHGRGVCQWQRCVSMAGLCALGRCVCPWQACVPMAEMVALYVVLGNVSVCSEFTLLCQCCLTQCFRLALNAPVLMLDCDVGHDVVGCLEVHRCM